LYARQKAFERDEMQDKPDQDISQSPGYAPTHDEQGWIIIGIEGKQRREPADRDGLREGRKTEGKDPLSGFARCCLFRDVYAGDRRGQR
jgi:hypothetical protein